MVTGLAWTAMGGATLSIESSKIHTLHRGFKLTGQLGEVMKESAEIAHSFVVAHLRILVARATFRYVHGASACTRGCHAKGWAECWHHDGDRTGIAGAR